MIVDSLESLKGMNVDTSHWDPMLNKLIIPKWDPETIQLFENKLEDSKQTPTLEVIKKFLTVAYRYIPAKPNWQTTEPTKTQGIHNFSKSKKKIKTRQTKND